MKRYLLLLASAATMVCANAEETGSRSGLTPRGQTDQSAQTLDALIHVTSPARSGMSGIRFQLLQDAGRKLGFRGGLQQRGLEIAQGLDARDAALEKIFQFSSLISVDGVLPPVIVEASDVATFAPDQIRTADHVYRIVKEERFVSVPPTWRDYLLSGLVFKSKLDLPDIDARPKDDSEEAIWRDAVTAGWQEGVGQADAILSANFNRLTRDFTGMMLYSTLMQQGQIKRTKVAESVQTVSGNGNRMLVGDKLRRIVGKAALDNDARNWKPTIQTDKNGNSKVGSGNVAKSDTPH